MKEKLNRRSFLKLMGLTSGAAMLPSCKPGKTAEKLIPYLVPPEEGVMPGTPVYYKTTCTECPAHCGLSVKAYDKVHNGAHGVYPVKLEGIPGHPINDGTLCVRGQASLTRLYHPQRLRHPVQKDSSGGFKDISWKDAYAGILAAITQAQESKRQNVYLSSRVTGSQSELIDLFASKMKVERLAEFEPYAHSALRQANKILFNKKSLPLYDIENSDLLVTLGADIIETFISPVYHTVALTKAKNKTGFKWIHCEPHLSLSGINANAKYTIRPGSEPYLLAFLLKQLVNNISPHPHPLPQGEREYTGNALSLGERGRGEGKRRLSMEVLELIPEFSVHEVADATGISEEQIKVLLDSFSQAKSPLLISGGVSLGHAAGIETAVLTGLIQLVTGMVNSLLKFEREENYSGVESLLDMENLANRLKEDKIGVIFMSKTNPVFSLPAGYSFRGHLKKANLRVGLGDFINETMAECDIILPLSHSLETWGDAVPRKGLRTVIRPAISKPLHDTLSEGDILLQIMKEANMDTPAQSYEEYVRMRWNAIYGAGFKEEFVEKGYIEEPVRKEPVALQVQQTVSYLKQAKFKQTAMSGVVVVVTPSVRTFDGRSAELELLNEIPDPLTTISYGKWVSVSGQLAKSAGLRDGDEVMISGAGWQAKYPAKIQPNLPADVLTVQRDKFPEPVFEVDPVSGEAYVFLDKISVSKTGVRLPMAVLSGSTSQKGRGILPLSGPIHEPGRPEQKNSSKSLYPEHEHKDYRWGLTIDLDRCIGCGACVAACHVENNVPVTGEKEHLDGRELSWLRLEPYYENGKGEFVVMLCQQCDYAPCEPVCPVYATYHTPEGLNAQVYNRCVGTRYCANNCPYKVRRYNWFTYRWQEPLNLMTNPEVSIRTQGIMEKCTFCVQRIRMAHDVAKDEGRKIRDGEATPACAQTCPAGAIVFGNMLDSESQVYKLAHSARAYRIFEHLGVEPAVHYLRQVKVEVKVKNGIKTD